MISAVLATGLHGGLLFSFANQIGATANQKTKTDISILDLPSVSNANPVEALSVAKIQQDKNARVTPSKIRKPKRLENTAQSKRKINQAISNRAERLKTNENSRIATQVKTATLTPTTKLDGTKKEAISNELSKTTPLASDIIKANKNKKEKLAAVKPKTTATSKTVPKVTETRKISAEKPAPQNSDAVKLSPNKRARPAEISTGSKSEKLISKTAHITASGSKPNFTQASTPVTPAKTATKIMANPKTPNTNVEPEKIKVISTSQLATRSPLNNSITKQVQPVTTSTSKVKSVSSAKRILSQKPKTAAPVQLATKKSSQIKTISSAKVIVSHNKQTPVSDTKPKRTISAVKPVKQIASTGPKTVVPVQLSAIAPTKARTVSSAKVFTSRNPQSAISIAMPKRAIGAVKTVKKITRVATKNSVPRIGAIKSLKQQIRKPETQTSAQPNDQVAMITRPNQVARELRAAPTKNQANEFAKVIDFLKFHHSENQCFLALPVVSNYERIELIGFSNEKSSWSQFQETITQSTKFKIPGRLNSISDAQCQVMKFARQNKLYPTFSATIELDQTEIKTGEIITGKLFMNEGRHFNMYVVDDEGIAINVNRLVVTNENDRTFKLRINLTGGEVSTSQLLLAIVTDKILQSTRFPDPISVNYLLENIKRETSRNKIQLDLALSAFVVR